MLYYQQVRSGNREELLVSYYDENGQIRFESINIPEREWFIWKQQNDNHIFDGTRSFDNHPIYRNKTKKLDRYRHLEIIHNLSPETQSKIHSINRPKLFSMDIETEVLTERIPDQSNPQEKILTNSIATPADTVIITGIKPISSIDKENLERQINLHIEKLNVKYKVVYRYYETEVMMLKDLIEEFIPKMPCITGWNVLKFDWAYITARADHLGLDSKMTSPTRTTYGFYIKDKYAKKGEKAGTVVNLPCHRGVVDYMALFENLDRSVKVKSSSALGEVAKEVLGLPKVSYQGSLMDLYNNDYVKYLFYNAIDAILVREIDKKIKTLDGLLLQSSLGKVPLHEANFASDIIEMLFSQIYLGRNQHFHYRVSPDKEKYPGAYVKEPDIGFYQWVLGSDFEALYPSSIISANIGEDTYLGMQTGDDDGMFIDRYTKELKKIDLSKHINSEYGIYTKDHDSVPVEALKILFGKRVEMKKESAELTEEIHYLKSLL